MNLNEETPLFLKKGGVYYVISSGLKIAIALKTFSIWLHYLCQVPPFAPGNPCPRVFCAETMDVHGDQSLHDKYGRQRIAFHDDQATLMGSDFALSARHFTLEPRKLRELEARPYTRATNAIGGIDYFDVTFVIPLAPFHR